MNEFERLILVNADPKLTTRENPDFRSFQNSIRGAGAALLVGVVGVIGAETTNSGVAEYVAAAGLLVGAFALSRVNDMRNRLTR